MDQLKHTVWLSKYALSGGIAEYQAEIRDGMAYPGKPFMSCTSFKMGVDAHNTREAAVMAAEAAAKKKIASLRKQIAKLETTAF
jgi:predicted sulfurtransferase